MTPLDRLGRLIGLEALSAYAADPRAGFTHRDEIKRVLAGHICRQTTAHWLSVLEPADVWCAAVADWPSLLASDGFRALDMLQGVVRADGRAMLTTRVPLRIGGERPASSRAAPAVGEHTVAIVAEFGLDAEPSR
jgi:crotonobetainyl-CoA:carnitine CoA-transferase CaiB-like acyl-CoA transferase